MTRRKLANRAATVRKIVTQTNHKINNLSGEGEDTKTWRQGIWYSAKQLGVCVRRVPPDRSWKVKRDVERIYK